MKLKEGLKQTILTLDFNPQKFQAWQNKFRIYYRTSRMNTADTEEQRGYFYSCISEHLQAVITRNIPAGANIFPKEGQEDEACFDELAKEFNLKYPLSTWRYEWFMMRQPYKGKTMSYYLNTLQEAADIVDIYQLTLYKLLITLTLANCLDEALKQELIIHHQARTLSMQEIQEEVNKWETCMNTESRMLGEKQQRV